MKSKGKKSPGPLGRVIFSRVIFITILHYLSLLTFSLFMRSRLFFIPKTGTLEGATRVCQQHATSIQQRLALHVHTQGALHNFSLFLSLRFATAQSDRNQRPTRPCSLSTRLCNCASITKNRRLDGAMGNKKKTTNLGSLFFQKRKIIP